MATKDGKKTGGRKAGTPNKETRSLEERAAEKGIDFWDLLCETAADINDPRRFDAIKTGCEYLYTKRTAVKVDGSVEISLVEMARRIIDASTEELKMINDAN